MTTATPAEPSPFDGSRRIAEMFAAARCTCVQEIVDTFGDPRTVRRPCCPVHHADPPIDEQEHR